MLMDKRHLIFKIDDLYYTIDYTPTCNHHTPLVILAIGPPVWFLHIW